MTEFKLVKRAYQERLIYHIVRKLVYVVKWIFDRTARIGINKYNSNAVIAIFKLRQINFLFSKERETSFRLCV